MKRHHLDPPGTLMLVEPALDDSAVLLRHLTDFPVLDNRHRVRDGMPRLPGSGRAVENRVQGMRRSNRTATRRRGSGMLPVELPYDGLSV